jgi:glycosyltransferase involved in cell wall biosynthesis
MQTPKVSIIIPTSNRAQLLIRAIKSVLNQTFQDFELIIVDDGSTDNTKEIVEQYQKNDSRIKYIWQENSGSPPMPKNIGIKHSQGKYIAFLDSDDEWLFEKLEKQLKLFKQGSNKLGLVGCDAIIVNEKTTKQWIYHTPKYSTKDNFVRLLDGNFVCSTSSTMIKKSVLDDVGDFDENFLFPEDWDLWIRISQKYRIDFVYEPLFKYYFHQRNVSLTSEVHRKIQDYEYLCKKHSKYYLKYPKYLSKKLRFMGSLYCCDKNVTKGREKFSESIKANPMNIKSYLYFILSLFGANFYNKLFSLAVRLRNNTI